MIDMISSAALQVQEQIADGHPAELRLPLTNIEFTSFTSFSLSNSPMELEAPGCMQLEAVGYYTDVPH
jgi:hypothetical protein